MHFNLLKMVNVFNFHIKLVKAQDGTSLKDALTLETAANLSTVPLVKK